MDRKWTFGYTAVNWELELEITSRKSITLKSIADHMNADAVERLEGKGKEDKDVASTILVFSWYFYRYFGSCVGTTSPDRNLIIPDAPMITYKAPKNIVLHHVTPLTLPEIVTNQNVQLFKHDEKGLIYWMNIKINLAKFKAFERDTLARWLKENPEVRTTQLLIFDRLVKDIVCMEKNRKKQLEAKENKMKLLQPLTWVSKFKDNASSSSSPNEEVNNFFQGQTSNPSS
uniref:Matrix protein n=1 Tax=Aristolochia-associated cytorhabdovirus TaxID=3071548 RepID=A0AA50QTM6_9RHAB|nr:matrix protein [Aristolochia-associated cytorhabdovirus]